MLNIATWFYKEKKGEESKYLQVRGTSSSFSFQAVYWRCIYVFYKTSLMFNKNSKHTFYTNLKVEELPVLDGVSFADFFNSNNIDVITVDLKYRTPKGYYKAWQNQFYVFDVLKEFIKITSDDEQLLLLDSDCIFRSRVESLTDNIKKGGILNYDMRYGEDHNVNGLTRKDMGKLYAELFPQKKTDAPIYYGGEIFAGDVKNIKLLIDEFELLWDELLNRFTSDKIRFYEEAHALSYLYFKLDKENDALSKYIHRIWTSPIYRVIPEDVENLPIWHLPAEKRRGIKKMFFYLKSPKKVDVNIYLKKSGKLTSVVKRTFFRFIADITLHLAIRIKQKLAK